MFLSWLFLAILQSTLPKPSHPLTNASATIFRKWTTKPLQPNLGCCISFSGNSTTFFPMPETWMSSLMASFFLPDSWTVQTWKCLNLNLFSENIFFRKSAFDGTKLNLPFPPKTILERFYTLWLFVKHSLIQFKTPVLDPCVNLLFPFTPVLIGLQLEGRRAEGCGLCFHFPSSFIRLYKSFFGSLSEVPLPQWIHEPSSFDCHSFSDPVLRSRCESFRILFPDMGAPGS